MASMQFEEGDSRFFQTVTQGAMDLLNEAGFPHETVFTEDGKQMEQVFFSAQGEWDAEPCNGVWVTRHLRERIDAYWMVIRDRGAALFWNSATGILDTHRDDLSDDLS